MNACSIAILFALAVVSPLLAADPSDAKQCFRITLTDEETVRGVPLVELKPVDGLRFYTDSNGVAAIDEPELIGEETFFHISSHGYEFPKDGLGFRGKRLTVTRGGSAQLTIRRINIAQ